MNLGALYLCCAVLAYGANAQGSYEPTTDAEREIAADCLLNLPSRAKYSQSLLSFDTAFFQVRETDLSPNENKFLEDCSTINVTNSSDTSAIRAIIEAPEYPPVCYDVLFTAADGSAVVCGYLPIYASPIIDYEPATLEERIARHQCRQGLDIPDTFRFRPALIRVEANPSAALPGYVLFDTTVPQDGDDFAEDCTPISQSAGSNTDGAETRQVILLIQTNTCHDVLFLAGGTDPVVCLYVPNSEGGVTSYTPQTDSEQEVESECKKTLPERNKYSAVLRQYPGYQVWETNTPNVDEFQEDCSTLNVVNSPDATLRDIVVRTEGEQICNDVLFYTSDSVPVACDYEPIFAEGITDYMPTTAANRDIEKDCQENLPHPNGTRVALVEYEANPEGKFPGYHLVNVTYHNEGSPFREDCSLVFNPPENATADPRPVIFITESSTCHDVLYFEGQNPVVCLYIIPNNATVVVRIPQRPAIVALTLTCLSVIASAILLITHIIFPSLQTLPSKVVMNLATAFLLGDIFYIIQLSLLMHNATRLTKEAEAIAVIAFYFFFARFFWMALSGFEMCRTIHVGTQLRFNSPQKRRQLFIIYLITGWSLPVIPTSIMAIVHYEKLESDFGESSLFGIGGFVVTLVPIGIVVLFNIGVIVYLTYVLYQARKWQVKVSSAISSNRRKTNFTRIFIIILSLLGVTWFSLFLLYIDGVSTNESVQIIASFFNTLQPIFVCVSFICTKKIYRKYKNLISGKPDEEVTDASTVQNRFRNRRLLSFLFTDKELENSVPKYRFGRSATRSDSKLSNTSVSILMRDSTSNSLAPSTNGCSPPRDPPSLAPITEEMETEEIANEESPNHVTVDLKDSTL